MKIMNCTIWDSLHYKTISTWNKTVIAVCTRYSLHSIVTDFQIIFSLVANDVFFFSNIIHCHTIYIFLGSKEKLFWCQNLGCDYGSSPTNPIAWALPKWSYKEDMLHCNIIIMFMLHQINQRFKIFKLQSCSITKILNPVDSGVS